MRVQLSRNAVAGRDDSRGTVDQRPPQAQPDIGPQQRLPGDRLGSVDLAANYVGDTQWITGVVREVRDAVECGVVTVELSARNQRADVTYGGRAIVLGGLPPVRQIAGRNDQLRLQALQQVGERMLDDGAVAGPDMQIRKVEDARNHRRSRLYSE